MNAERRKALSKIHDTLGELITEIESLYEEEEAAYDNLPESLQDSERGEAMQEALSNLEDLQGSLEDAVNAIEEITEGE